MIAMLTGVVQEKTEKSITVVSGQVGYEVFCTLPVLEQTALDATVTLFTYQYVREDSLELYGFRSAGERNFFKQLIGVTGVGPKSALTVMALASLDELQSAIVQGDASLLTKVSGIGTKTAERIIVELKRKLATSHDIVLQPGADGDAIDALMGLGYSAKEARDALRAIPSEMATTRTRVQAALKLLGKQQ
ncbi:MAG: Holliday junction branch migration protein RuvA [Patescibacteria group bacterium]